MVYLDKQKGYKMLDKLRTFVTVSKYTDLYCKIIDSVKGRVKFAGCERHHIVPKSIWAGGTKLKKNISYLTPREHYLCHRLLAKIMVSSENAAKMHSALWLMVNAGNIVARTSRVYEQAKQNKSSAMRVQWQDPAYRASVIANRQWFYRSEEQKEANRQRGLAKPKEQLDKFIQAGSEAGKKVRDADPKAWVARSMGSSKGRKRAKESCQTAEFKEFCKTRELSKSVEDRQKLAKQGQQALVNKCGGEDAYRKMLSERIKGRKAYIHPVTGQVKITRECPEGFVLKKGKR